MVASAPFHRERDGETTRRCTRCGERFDPGPGDRQLCPGCRGLDPKPLDLGPGAVRVRALTSDR